MALRAFPLIYWYSEDVSLLYIGIDSNKTELFDAFSIYVHYEVTVYVINQKYLLI